MLSNKWTFSLTSLVVLLAFGLVCFAPSAFADGDVKKTHFDLGVSIRAGESMIDVDARGTADDIQIATGRDRASRTFTGGDSLIITLLVEFTHTVELHRPDILADDVVDPEADLTSGAAFGADDVSVRAFDKEGRPLGSLPLSKLATTGESIFAFRDAQKPGRQFLIRLDDEKLTSAYRTALRAPTDAGLEIYSLFFYIGKGSSNFTNKELSEHSEKLPRDAGVSAGIRKVDAAHFTTHFGPDAHQHLNSASNVFRVDLVDDDQGDAQYAALTSSSTAMDVARNGDDTDDGRWSQRQAGTPGVVSIMRIVDRSGFVESGDFDVRIILTEEPMDGLTTDKIMVENGSVKSGGIVKGLTYKGGHNEITMTRSLVELSQLLMSRRSHRFPQVTIPQRVSELGPAMIDYYHVGGAEC